MKKMLLCGLLLLLICVVPVAADSTIDITTGLPVNSSVNIGTSVQAYDNALETNAVLWDLSHGVSDEYQPSGRYSQFAALFASRGYPITTTTTGVLSVDLTKYKMLVINLGSSWNSAYSPAEVTAIKNFVDNGGRLLILGDNSHCPNANINPISQAFGTTLGVFTLDPNDQDISDLATHRVFIGVSSLFMPAVGKISAVSPSKVIAWSDKKEPVIAVAGNNRVLIFGDINLFDNYFINNADNKKLASNLASDLWGSFTDPGIITIHEVATGPKSCTVRISVQNPYSDVNDLKPHIAISSDAQDLYVLPIGADSASEKLIKGNKVWIWSGSQLLSTIPVIGTIWGWAQSMRDIKELTTRPTYSYYPELPLMTSDYQYLIYMENEGEPKTSWNLNIGVDVARSKTYPFATYDKTRFQNYQKVLFNHFPSQFIKTTEMIEPVSVNQFCEEHKIRGWVSYKQTVILQNDKKISNVISVPTSWSFYSGQYPEKYSACAPKDDQSNCGYSACTWSNI